MNKKDKSEEINEMIHEEQADQELQDELDLESNLNKHQEEIKSIALLLLKKIQLFRICRREDTLMYLIR